MSSSFSNLRLREIGATVPVRSSAGTPLKVLVSCFAFSPVKGSEFATGWNYVQAIARRHKVWLITRSNEKEETEQFLREHPGLMPNLTIHYIPWTESDFKYPLNEIPHYFLYRHWQWRAYLLGRSLDAQID